MSGQAWARFGFGTGVSASLAANVGHSFINHTPPVGAILASAFWPVALLITIEVISRVAWPDGFRWKAVRYGGLTTVALIAAAISYRHMSSLLGSYGEDSFSAMIGPLAVDGLMAVSSAAMLAIAENARRANVVRRPIIGRVVDE